MPSLPTLSPPQALYDRLVAAFDNDPEKYKRWLAERLQEYVREQEMAKAERDAQEAVEAAAQAAQEAAAQAEQDRQAAIESVYEELRQKREQAENLEV